MSFERHILFLRKYTEAFMGLKRVVSRLSNENRITLTLMRRPRMLPQCYSPLSYSRDCPIVGRSTGRCLDKRQLMLDHLPLVHPESRRDVGQLRGHRAEALTAPSDPMLLRAFISELWLYFRRAGAPAHHHHYRMKTLDGLGNVADH